MQAEPSRALWLAFLDRARLDLAGSGKTALDAWRWLDHADFRQVCELAGVEPEWALAALQGPRTITKEN